MSTTVKNEIPIGSFDNITSSEQYDVTRGSLSAENVTSPVNYFEIRRKQLASFIINLLLSMLLLYILLILVYFAYKNNHLLICCRGIYYQKYKKQSILNCLIMLAAVNSLFFTLMQLPMFAFPTQVYCNFFPYIVFINYTASLLGVYAAFYYRVYISFYNHPILKQNISMSLQITAKYVFLPMFVIAIALLAFALHTYGMKKTEYGCKASTKETYVLIVMLGVVIETTTAQLILLFLLSYPLYLNSRNMLKKRTSDTNKTITVIKRSAIVACFCISFDIAAAVFAIVEDQNTTFPTVYVICSFNLLINLLGVILSFKNWKEKLLSFQLCNCKPVHISR